MFMSSDAAVARLRPKPRRSPVATENARSGGSGWAAPSASARPIEGYASETSVYPGGTVHLHVSTAPAGDYRIEVYRLGWYGDRGGRLITCIPGCDATEPGTSEPVPAPDPSTGLVRATWPVTDTVTVGSDWTSGYYLARLVRADGARPTCVLFVVREDPSRASNILVVSSVNTWQAYNSWGGKSLYNYSSTSLAPANRVSFDRPWGPGSQAQFFEWGIHLVRFLERGAYDVSYVTDVDVDRDPSELLHHSLVIVNGHSEYWTSRMRDAYETARDAGVNLMFMGANDGYWNVRYEDDRRTIVSYKSTDDPVTDPAGQTVLFRSLTPPRYECALLGVAHQGAIERGDAPALDFQVVDSAIDDRWFVGTGFDRDSVLRGLVGPEWDQVVDPKKAYSCDFSAEQFTTFFHYEGEPGNADTVRYVAPSGAIVFSAGSLQFVWGLDDYRLESAPGAADPRLQQFVRNALADMTRRSPGGTRLGRSWP
jgi:hypothetical protein